MITQENEPYPDANDTLAGQAMSAVSVLPSTRSDLDLFLRGKALGQKFHELFQTVDDPVPVKYVSWHFIVLFSMITTLQLQPTDFIVTFGVVACLFCMQTVPKTREAFAGAPLLGLPGAIIKGHSPLYITVG